MLTMVGATLTHVRLHEQNRLAAPLIVLGLALLVAVARFGTL